MSQISSPSTLGRTTNSPAGHARVLPDRWAANLQLHFRQGMSWRRKIRGLRRQGHQGSLACPVLTCDDNLALARQQSAKTTSNLAQIVVGPEGLEPSTKGLKVPCAAIAPRTRAVCSTFLRRNSRLPCLFAARPDGSRRFTHSGIGETYFGAWPCFRLFFAYAGEVERRPPSLLKRDRNQQQGQRQDERTRRRQALYDKS